MRNAHKILIGKPERGDRSRWVLIIKTHLRGLVRYGKVD
jgi:hypothetical protein